MSTNEMLYIKLEPQAKRILRLRAAAAGVTMSAMAKAVLLPLLQPTPAELALLQESPCDPKPS